MQNKIVNRYLKI